MDLLSIQLRKEVHRYNADLVGFADLSHLPAESRNHLPNGISLMLKLNPQILSQLEKGPTPAYYLEYQKLNRQLDEMAIKVETYIKNLGYNAVANTTKLVTKDEKSQSTKLPHKTVATLAGLGWIGKTALLITPEFGSAIRLTTVLTDMPLEVGKPMAVSKCGTCDACVTSCPVDAASGQVWEFGMDRDDLYDVYKCEYTTRELSEKAGLNATLCGICIYKCPYSQAYIKRSI